ncbi:MAG: TIGR03936 family radical SAM-associated protein [Caldilineaceae bacterium]
MNDSLNQPTAHSQSPDEAPRQRVRILYEKGEAVKFISHLDEFRLWERALRRADLPLLYKQGFNPQPHIQFASPLGVGFTGVAEPIDITFAPPLPLDELRTRIQAKLPPAVQIHAIEEVPLKTTALQSVLIGADYSIIIYAEPDEIDPQQIETAIADFLAKDELWSERERKGAKYRYNLRPLIYELRYEGYDAASEEHRIFLRVQQREGATGRPDEVVSALGFDNFARTLRRLRLYTSESAEDAAIFAQYPVVDKADINVALGGRRRKRRRGPQKESAKPEGKYAREGRSINERAADEFV